MGDPINGLRGFASLHVMLGHYSYSLADLVDFQPGMEMPVFFLLSGYCMTLGYGKGTLNTRSYLQNRMARILPLYYLINLLTAPIHRMISGIFALQFSLSLHLIATLFCTNSWFFIFDAFFPKPYNPNCWTINTLWFFYLVYPLILPRLQALSDAAISRLLVILYYVQLVPFLYYWHYQMKYKTGYETMTKSPFMRLPVFIMGVLGGLQTQRWMDRKDFQDPNEDRLIVHDILPWGLFGSNENKPIDREKSRFTWGARADLSALVFITVCSLKLMPYYILNKDSLLRTLVQGYGQLILVHVMLNLIIGLSRGKNESRIANIFSHWIFQKLGAISFALYIIHEPVRKFYLANISRRKKWLNRYELMAVYVVAIFLAYLVHKLIENPLANLLRYKKKKSAPISQV